MKLRSVLVVATACTVVAGCSTVRTEVKRDTAGAGVQTRDVVSAMSAQMRAMPPLVERVDRAYIGARTQVVSRDQGFPPVMRADVAMVFDDGRPVNALGEVSIPIATLAERLTLATGVPTRVKSDVYLPLSALVPGRAQPVVTQFSTAVSGGATSLQTGQQGGLAGQRSAELVRGPASPAPITPVESVSVSLPARLVGPPTRILDLVKARVGINARYTEDGALEFYRLSTRTFQIAALPGDQQYTTQLGQTATGGNNFQATANVTTSANLRPFGSSVSAVRAMLTVAGTVVDNDATRTLTVTDTDDVLDAVSRYINDENRLLRRQVVLEIRTVSFRSNNINDLNFNWEALYTAVLEKYGYTINFASPIFRAGENAGQLGVLSTKGSKGDSRWTGSQAFISALDEIGDTKIERANILYTTSGRSVAYAVTNTFDYVYQTTSSAASLTAVSTGIQTKTDTVGRILSLLPVVINENAVAVDVMLNESRLIALKPFTTGQGIAQQTVQLPDKVAEQSRHSLILRDGDELVFSGLAQGDDALAKRSFGENISPLFGGGVKAQQQVTRTFLTIKVRVLDTL
jgi:type IVB pilus formation R64 PilN family outer membrane protein